MFGPEALCKILYLKMEEYFKYLKPFLILLNILPIQIINVKKECIVITDNIPIDAKIVAVLRKI